MCVSSWMAHQTGSWTWPISDGFFSLDIKEPNILKLLFDSWRRPFNHVQSPAQPSLLPEGSLSSSTLVQGESSTFSEGGEAAYLADLSEEGGPQSLVSSFII